MNIPPPPEEGPEHGPQLPGGAVWRRAVRRFRKGARASPLADRDGDRAVVSISSDERSISGISDDAWPNYDTAPAPAPPTQELAAIEGLLGIGASQVAVADPPVEDPAIHATPWASASRADFKNAFLTWNNFPEGIGAIILEFFDEFCTYLVYQTEKGANGTLHLHAYIEAKKKHKFTWWKKRFPLAHIECSRNREKSRAYCMKAQTRVDGPWELGNFVQGQRRPNELAEVARALAAGDRNLIDVARQNPDVYVRHHRGLQALIAAIPQERPDPPRVELLYGPPGCGKSRTARLGSAGIDYWASPIGSGIHWYDGYNGQEVAILDDFDGRRSEVKLSTLLQLLDRYPVQVPVKGGFTWWYPRVIFITTNLHPSTWFDFTGRESQFLALQRRITAVHHWRTVGDEALVIRAPALPDPEGEWARWWAGPPPPQRRELGPMDLYVEQPEPDNGFNWF